MQSVYYDNFRDGRLKVVKVVVEEVGVEGEAKALEAGVVEEEEGEGLTLSFRSALIAGSSKLQPNPNLTKTKCVALKLTTWIQQHNDEKTIKTL